MKMVQQMIPQSRVVLWLIPVIGVWDADATAQLITPADTVGVAVIGDELSEEGSLFESCRLEATVSTPVRPYNPYDFTWVEFLARRREMPFGSRELVSGRQFFRWSNNMARSCADSSEINQPDVRLGGQSQAEAVRDLVAAGQVDIVIIYIGLNDLLAGTTDDRIVTDTLTDADRQMLAALTGNVRAAWDTITAGLDATQRGKLRLIVAGVPDVGQTPFNTQVSARNRVRPDVGRQRIRAVVDGINGELSAWTLAQQNGIYADVAGMQDGVGALPQLQVGGETIDRDRAANEPTDMYQESGYPRSVLNSMLSNLILEAINRAIGKNLAMLTDREVLISAGMGGRFKRVTFVGRFDFAQYVTSNP